jgi:alkanesulfonate monooxygenase SsuD/methylene tetrahydromethanopterin reductase-like flavin-dependent oxidoreductase (luciferase family)
MTVQIFPGMLADLWSKLSRYLRDEGKDPDAFQTIAYHNININPDRAAALEETKRFLDAYYGPVFTPQMVEAWTAAGTTAQCAANLRELANAGAKSIALRITSWDQRGQFDRLVKEVLPLVNG